MGRGDRKTRKGKISIRSYGNARPHQARKSTAGTDEAKPSARPVARKAPAKKAAPRKSA